MSKQGSPVEAPDPFLSSHSGQAVEGVAVQRPARRLVAHVLDLQPSLGHP